MSDIATTSPLVSILMLTYNHAPYLAQAIESVLGQQTEYPFELIICDDASSDGTAELAREYASRDPRIVLSLQETNTRLGKNFADGCAKIRGKYVAFCEGDDYWTDPAKLQKQISFLEANPDFSISAHKVQILDMNNKQPNTNPQYIYKDCRADEDRIKNGVFYADEALANYYFQTGSLVLRWRFPGGFPHWYRKRMMFDHFLFMLHAVEGKIKYFDEAMSVWRRHGGGYSWLQTQDKGLFFQKEGEDWISLYQNMNIFFSGRFRLQIRERILLALRAIAANCITTGNIDQLRSMVNKYQPYLKDILKDAVLLDALRLAYPEKPEFAPPWQTAPSADMALPDGEKTESAENPPNTVGGVFELAMEDIPECADNVWDKWTGDSEYACFFNLRSALMRWLWQKGVTVLWLPAYLPPMLRINSNGCQLTCKFYRVNDKLEPAQDFLNVVEPGEAVLTINYLGRELSQNLAKKLCERKDILWVEDFAQSLDAPRQKLSDAVIYSPRKLFGVPDGGLLVADGATELAQWLEPANPQTVAERVDIQLRSFENNGGNPPQDLLWQKNEMEHQLSRHKMSRLTETLLKRISYGDVAKKRRENWKSLYENLGSYCLWPVEEPDFTPFAFPFVAPADFPLEILHTLLARHQIIVRRMWHPLPVPPNLFPIESRLSKRLLLLPCDQRYGADKMWEIADLVLRIIHNPDYFLGKIQGDAMETWQS